MAKSKVGFHIDIRAFPQEIDKIIFAGTRIIKVIQSLDLLQQVYAALGDKTTYIARHWAVGDSFQGFGVGLSAKAKAKAWYDAMLPYIQQVPFAFMEAFNEPDTSPSVLSAYNDFEVERQHIMHDNGYKCAIGSFSTGQPDLSVWPLFYPALAAAHQYKNILGLHEYSALYMDTYYGGNSAEAIRTGQRQEMPAAYSEGWLTFRYRKVWDQHIKPHGWTDLKIALTEYGLMSYSPPEIDAIAGYPVGPWRTCGRAWSDLNGRSDTENYYTEQLQWCDRQMQADPYVLGATVFTWGQYGWESDEIEGQVANNLVNYIHDTVDDPEPPQVNPMKTLGIDVSAHQGNQLDWQQIANAGYKYAFLRYSVGTGKTADSGKDITFDRNLFEAQKAGLLVGAYHYVWASGSIQDQIDLFLTLDPSVLDLPMVLDVENVSITLANLRLFKNEIERVTGRKPIIYTRKNIWEPIVGGAWKEWSPYLLWLALYTEEVGEYPHPLPNSWSNWTFWQYTSSGSVPGHAGNIDTNIYNGSLEDLKCRFAYPKVGDFVLEWPVDSSIVTQEFGANPANYAQFGLPGHDGRDFRAPTGANVYSMGNGVIKEVGNSASYGNYIRVDHQDSYEFTYAHLQSVLVSIGQRVMAKQRIGLANNTGNSSGSHLHVTGYMMNPNSAAQSAYSKGVFNFTPFLKPRQVSVQMRMNYTQDINLRAEPSVSSLDIGDVAVGEIVTAYPDSTVNEYLKVLAHGILGYALAKWFEVVTDVAVRLRSTASPYVNIRSGPSTAFSAVGRLYLGEEISGYPIAGDAFWRVIFNGADAWISASYLETV